MTSPSSGFQLAAVMEMPTEAMSSPKLTGLPYDILLNILSKLPASSVLQFRCVSKSLRHLVDDPALAAMHMAATNEHIDVEVRSLPHYSHKYLLKFVSCGLLGFRFYGVHHGYFGLYNPLRGEYLWLPQPEDGWLPQAGDGCKIIRWERFGMGFNSFTNTHKIVHFFSHAYPDGSTGMVARVHVLGTGSWRRIASVPPCSYLSAKNAYAYGNMHWLVKGDRILSFDFGEEKFQWTINPPHLDLTGVPDLYLVSLRGSLALVCVLDLEKKVEIWLYKEHKHWTKDHTYSMLLDRYCSNPFFHFEVGAWEHGIYIITNRTVSTVVYYDMRCDDRREYCRYQKLVHLFSYTESLISLKQYDNLRTNSNKKKNFLDAGDSHQFPLSELLNAPRVK